MFNAEMRKLLIEVISSWQVLAVTVVLILYVFLVNSVARIYRRSRESFMPKAKPDNLPPPAPSETASDADDDELGLEE